MATNREAIGRRLEALSRHSVAAAGGAGGGADAASSPRREVPYGKGDVTWSSGLRYTLNTDVLTRAEREKYERDGFHVVRGLFCEDELRKYETRFNELCEGKVGRTGIMTLMRDVTVKDRPIQSQADVNKIQNFEDDDVLFNYCTQPRILKYVEAFCGKDIKSVHTMLINKPPDSGVRSSRHPLHQDLHYFPFRPTDRICASWTAMERVTRANGCLVVIPGSHRAGIMYEHGYPQWGGPVNVAYHGILEYNDDWDAKRIWLDMEPGDTVFFHPLLIHGSGANTTKGYRKAISCHYANSMCEYIDVVGTTQETIKTEVEDIARKRLGKDVDVDYTDIWKAKSRLVQGEAGTL